MLDGDRVVERAVPQADDISPLDGWPARFRRGGDSDNCNDMAPTRSRRTVYFRTNLVGTRHVNVSVEHTDYAPWD